jgi:rSAM/selenodomain-associated transferase 1
MRTALGLFARAPVPGRCKSRLSARYGPEAAARIHALFLRHTTQRLANLQGADLYLVYAGEREAMAPFCRSPFRLLPQEGEGLGERMRSFFARAFGEGYRRVVVVGSDTPTLPLEYVEQAFDELRTCPVVFGPAYDGGYYLLGLSALREELFDGIPWGTSAVLVESLRRVGWQARLLPAWYDVDRPEDLSHLIQHVAMRSRVGGLRRGQPLRLPPGADDGGPALPGGGVGLGLPLAEGQERNPGAACSGSPGK